jgi:hypothetical protein
VNAGRRAELTQPPSDMLKIAPETATEIRQKGIVLSRY